MLHNAFEYMDDRIDPPSSLKQLTVQDIVTLAQENTIWTIDEDGMPIACLFTKCQSDHLYLGKLAVAKQHRRKWLATSLIAVAECQAREEGIECLRLETRIELVENHCAFARMGFQQIAETAHDGYDRPTSVTMEKPVGPILRL
jgi:N-acetylglutamate synthase-like GNAT family acetyltransferase